MPPKNHGRIATTRKQTKTVHLTNKKRNTRSCNKNVVTPNEKNSQTKNENTKLISSTSKKPKETINESDGEKEESEVESVVEETQRNNTSSSTGLSWNRDRSNIVKNNKKRVYGRNENMMGNNGSKECRNNNQMNYVLQSANGRYNNNCEYHGEREDINEESDTEVKQQVSAVTYFQDQITLRKAPSATGRSLNIDTREEKQSYYHEPYFNTETSTNSKRQNKETIDEISAKRRNLNNNHYSKNDENRNYDSEEDNRNQLGVSKDNKMSASKGNNIVTSTKNKGDGSITNKYIDDAVASYNSLGTNPDRMDLQPEHYRNLIKHLIRKKLKLENKLEENKNMIINGKKKGHDIESKEHDIVEPLTEINKKMDKVVRDVVAKLKNTRYPSYPTKLVSRTR